MCIHELSFSVFAGTIRASLSFMSSKRSEPGIDVYRGLAVILMFVSHVYRVQRRPPSRTSSAEVVAEWLMREYTDRESFVTASFLFLVGFSLALAQQSARRAGRDRWDAKHFRRAGYLYVLSMPLFVMQFGVVWPDMFVSADILSTIAVALVVTLIGLRASRPWWILGGMGLSSLAIAWWLEAAHLSVAGLNAGPGGLVPLLTFTAMGAGAALSYFRWGRRGLLVPAVVTAPLWGLALLDDWAWVYDVPSSYPVTHGLAITHLVSCDSGEVQRRTVNFLNLTARGTLAFVSPSLVVTALAIISGHNRFVRSVSSPARVIGRHALAAYVMHLGVLGVLELTGREPRSAVQSWALVGALVVVSWVLGKTLESEFAEGGVRKILLLLRFKTE